MQEEENSHYDCGHDGETDHCIPKVYVYAHRLVQREVVIQLAIGQGSYSISAHSERNKSHLKEN